MWFFKQKPNRTEQLEQTAGELIGKCHCVEARIDSIERRLEKLEEHDRSCDANFVHVAETLARLAKYHEHE